jgi:DNA-binding GntR family transcriptional regulator
MNLEDASDAPALAQRWTTADRVYQQLEELVISGRLKPGDRLTELSLAEWLRVSRTPLRQALQRLVSKGWIERASNGAIYVVDVSEAEIEALYAVRSALEDLVLRQAAARMTLSDLAALRALLAAQEHAAKRGDAAQVSDHGERFHRLLWSLSGNHVGVQFLQEVLQRTTRYRRLSFVEPQRFRKGLKQHAALLSALEKGAIDEARELLRIHVDESRVYVLQAFRSWRKSRAVENDPRRSTTLQKRPRRAVRS